MSEPTTEELQVLEKFRENIKDLNLSPESSTDLQLLRWLRARDLNIPKASEMLRKSMDWRKNNNIDNILEWKAPERFEKDYPYEFTGIDKNTGHPILIWPIGLWDFRKAVALGETEECISYTVQLFEKLQLKMKEASKLVGWEVTQAKLLVDYENFSLRTFTTLSSILLPISQRFEENYPETLHTVVKINCARAFQLAFALLKTVLSGRTVSKVHVFSNETSWKPVVAKIFPLDTIPEKYGGTKKCVISNAFDDLKPDEDLEMELKVIEINPGEIKEIEINVPGPKMEMIWLFIAGKEDIGFSLTSKDKGTEEVAYKIYRYDPSNAEGFTGAIPCYTGIYIGYFDNSFGKVKKQIKYTFNTMEIYEQQNFNGGKIA